MSRIKTESLKITLFLLAVAAGGGNGLFGQVASLPEEPNARLIAQNKMTPAMLGVGIRTVSPVNTTNVEPEKLTLKDAEQTAIKNNPRVSVGRLLALAQHQVVRQSKAAELPTVVGSVTAEEAEEASRISAGSLTASRLFEHAGVGANAS